MALTHETRPARTGRGHAVAWIAATLAALLIVGIFALTQRSGGQVAVIGDSITVLSKPYFARAFGSSGGADVRATSGKRIDQMLPALKAALKAKPRAVVVNLGTNDVLQGQYHPNWRPAFDRMIELLAPKHCVVLTTISSRAWSPTALPAEADVINRAITTAAAAHPNFHILDWNALVHSPNGDALLYFDKVHPSPNGQALLAQQAQEIIKRDC
jgi:lysophospholipase L1-like esterase